MQKLEYLRLRLAAIQEWSRVERACIPIALAGLLYLQYGVWSLFAPAPRGHAFLAGLSALVVAGAVLLLMLARVLDRRHPDALWFQHLAANFYSVSMVGGVYTAGTLSLPAGVVLAGAPLLGFLLLDRRVTLVAFAVTFGGLLALNLAAASGRLPYAPALPVPQDSDSALFWVGSQLAFAAPHLLVNIALCVIVLDRWRRREAHAFALSINDALTQVYNRSYILDRLEAEVAVARRDGTALSVALLDLDFFKQVNDRYGHLTGDRVLRAAARLLRTMVRAGDTVGRFGGEEFLVLLPDTEADDAAAVMERCRRELQALVLTTDGGEGIPLSASFGVACCDTRLEPVGAALVQAADVALYRAKQAGRNCVMVADRATVAAAVDADTGQAAATDLREIAINQPWWQSRSGWKQKAARVLDWSLPQKAALFLGLVLIMQVGALIGMLVDLRLPGAVALAGADVARTVVWLQLAQSAAAVLLLGIALKLHQHRYYEAPWFEHLTLQFAGFALVSMGYGTGSLGISTGVGLTVVPLVAFILFRHDAVLAAVATTLLGVAGLAYASALGLLPYAPLLSFAAPAWQLASPFWVLSNYLFFLPLLCVGLVLADQMLGRWRERELRIRRASLTDALTGVHNRRSILGLLEAELARSAASGATVAVVIVDIDHFKKVNDSFGHRAGDRVLQEVTRVLRAALRPGDAVGRYGGEEFLMVLPGTPLEGAKALAERCCSLLAATVIRAEDGKSVAVTASFGLASTASAANFDSTALIRLADRALYRAKERGRNCVQAA